MKKAEQKLDELFTTSDMVTGRDQPDITGLIGQYAHGNEPSQPIAWLYGRTGAYSKAQDRIRQILNDFYKPTPDGLIGNEDCGQMSAWYVLSSIGIYQVTPGSPYFDLTTPIFPKIVINLENGKKFSILTPGLTQTNHYLLAARLEKPHEIRKLSSPSLSFADITGGRPCVAATEGEDPKQRQS